MDKVKLKLEYSATLTTELEVNPDDYGLEEGYDTQELLDAVSEYEENENPDWFEEANVTVKATLV